MIQGRTDNTFIAIFLPEQDSDQDGFPDEAKSPYSASGQDHLALPNACPYSRPANRRRNYSLADNIDCFPGDFSVPLTEELAGQRV